MSSESAFDSASKRNRHSDVTFAFYNEDRTEKKTLNAHRICLANASDVFETMFFGNLPAASDQEITIEEISPEIFEIMLNYIYSNIGGIFKIVSLEIGMELLKAAKMYMIHELEELCEQSMGELVTTSSALQMLEFSIDFEMKILKSAALKSIREDTRTIIQTASFKDVAMETLLEIVQQDGLEATELELFNAVESVAKHKGVVEGSRLNSSSNSAELKTSSAWKDFRKIIHQIRFLDMTQEQFFKGPALSLLLTSDDITFIAISLAHPCDIRSCYPKEFVQSERKLSVRLVFFSIKAKGLMLGRIVMELRGDVVPKAARSFFDQCIKRNGFKGKQLNEINSDFCSIKSSINISDNYSESTILKHMGIGTLTMELKDDGVFDTRTPCFSISFRTTQKYTSFGTYNIVIGKVVEGLYTLKEMSSCQEHDVFIEDCGELK